MPCSGWLVLKAEPLVLNTKLLTPFILSFYFILEFQYFQYSIFYIETNTTLINNVVLVSSKVIQLYIYMFLFFFPVLFPFRLLQNTEQSSMRYTVGPFGYLEV